jgi:hypothetical protein
MFHNDYLMRMLEQVSQVVAYMTGLRRAGQHEKADTELELAYMQHVGLSGELFDRMAAENIMELLNLSGQDWVRVAITANLMLQDAEGCRARGEERAAWSKGRKAWRLMAEAKRYLDSGGFDIEFMNLERFAAYAEAEDAPGFSG